MKSFSVKIFSVQAAVQACTAVGYKTKNQNSKYLLSSCQYMLVLLGAVQPTIQYINIAMRAS